MSKVIITVGVSASGKTTWAKEQQGYIITNRDDLRMSLWGVDENRHLPYGKFGQKFLESLVTKIQYLTIEEAIKNNRNIIVSDTNLNKKYREQLIKFCEDLGATVEIKVFDITFEEAYKRSATRKNGVTHDVLVKQFKQFDETFGFYKQTDFSSQKESAIIVDIDGTLAHMVNRTAFEFDKVSTDTWDEDVLKIIKAYLNDGYKLVICSGRDDSCRKETEEWLDQQLEGKYILHMRETGDRRSDDIVKHEIYINNIYPFFNVYAVFDDRPKVVRMWHRIGIRKVFACGNQFVEF